MSSHAIYIIAITTADIPMMAIICDASIYLLLVSIITPQQNKTLSLAEVDGETVRKRRLGDWDSVPLTLAQDSLSGEVTTSLVDIGAGTARADYADKDVRGKLVLTSSQPGSVVERAVGELGAAGKIQREWPQRWKGKPRSRDICC